MTFSLYHGTQKIGTYRLREHAELQKAIESLTPPHNKHKDCDWLITED